MAQGFKSVDREISWLLAAGDMGDFVQINFGNRTGWKIVAEYEGPSGTLWVTFEAPISYRVHDERELVAYWAQRDEEGAPISFAYEIGQSVYVDELRQGVTAFTGLPLRYFIACGQDMCLEVIASDLPVVSTRRPTAEEQAG